MDGIELLRNWPTWRQANAARVLASPAWRLGVHYRGELGELRLRPVDEVPEAVWLTVKVEAEEHQLGILDSEAYPDLHALWALRDRLPREVFLALVEKECGGVFQMLEDVLRRQLSIVGLSEKGGGDRLSRFDLTLPGFDGVAISFLLNLSTAMEIELGRFEYIDVGHDSIRTLSREVEVQYAACSLEPTEIAALKPGDHVLLPEESAPAWILDEPNDALVGIVAEQPGSLTFAELMDATLPPPPQTENFRIVQRGRTIAHAHLGRLGAARVATIDALAST